MGKLDATQSAIGALGAVAAQLGAVRAAEVELWLTSTSRGGTGNGPGRLAAAHECQAVRKNVTQHGTELRSG
jgi:hypothetical protein